MKRRASVTAVKWCASKSWLLSIVFATGCLVLATACTSQTAPVASPTQTAAASGPASGVAPPRSTPVGGSGTVEADPNVGPLSLRSTAFPANGLIPVNFSCAGDNTSPPLTWHGAAPAGTTSWAIVMRDLDVTPGPWIQWMVTGIPVGTRSVSAGQVAAGSVARRASNSTPGFVGMCPPAGKIHRYRFTVYADGGRSPIPAAATAEQLLVAIEKGSVGTAVLNGRFAR